ncbi:methyltransferase domain-containing protein [Paraburkholderia sp. EG285A]|uniref:methyltransferase domain-containing protein n=1 Tax=Paraburkholderia sp. EG285A TaxID=3237009 RepID=UPI0034D30151
MNISTSVGPRNEEPLSQAIRDAWSAGRRDDACQLADRLARGAAECGDAAGLHLAAVVALECGLPELALVRLDTALQLVRGTRSACLWSDHGRTLLALGSTARAAGSLRRALAVDPDLAPARVNLGVTLAARGDRRSAIALVRRCVDEAPRFMPAYPLLARWLVEQHNYAEAARWLLEAARRWPLDASIRAQRVDLLNSHPEVVLTSAEHEASFVALLRHVDVDPQHLAAAGWLRLADDVEWVRRFHADETLDDLGALACALSSRPLALELISQVLPPNRTVERMLSSVRRWLLLSNSERFPALSRAFAWQCRANGGAWPVLADEAAACNRLSIGRSIRAAYPVNQPQGPAKQNGAPDDIASRLRVQYDTHCYPVWQRITRRPAQGFARFCGPFRKVSYSPLSRRARILVAGCGTGRHAVQLASAMPDADILAIDISAASLRYAEERARALGMSTISFVCLDLHDVMSLGDSFDHIECAGVLHHLADPEAGWRALIPALAPGGTMRIGLYSAVARRSVAAARRHIADLVMPRCDDDALRAARARLLSLPHDDTLAPVWRYTDFYSLAGFRDLVANTHEDPFDIARVARALAALGLQFLGFDQIAPDTLALKHALLPSQSDVDLAGWATFEQIYPETFRSMYQFWCRPW